MSRPTLYRYYNASRDALLEALVLDALAVTRVELHDVGGRTRMTLTDGPYVESRHAEAGWSQALDKLTAALAR